MPAAPDNAEQDNPGRDESAKDATVQDETVQDERQQRSSVFPLSGRPGDSMNLLGELIEHSIDDDYYSAAERTSEPSQADRRWRRGMTLVAVVVFAVLLTVAAVQTYKDRPETEVENEVLVEQLRERESSVAELQDRIDEVRDKVESLEAGASDPEFDERIVDESIAVGRFAVTGPGAEIVVDNADNASSHAQGRIRDTDLQMLVNGLWNAGAEAIAINDQRITTLTAIRTGGEAITVNYRSITAPYTVQAIGDMDTLAARFLETQAGGTWSALANNYGVHFDVSSEPELSLPAAPAGRIEVRQAEVKGDHE